MDTILTGLVRTICMVYIDDIVVWGRNEAEHAKKLCVVLQHLSDWTLWLHLDKCALGLEKIKLLDYIVGKDGIRPDPAKATAIANLGTTSGVQKVRSFLECLGTIDNVYPNMPISLSP